MADEARGRESEVGRVCFSCTAPRQGRGGPCLNSTPHPTYHGHLSLPAELRPGERTYGKP